MFASICLVDGSLLQANAGPNGTREEAIAIAAKVASEQVSDTEGDILKDINKDGEFHSANGDIEVFVVEIDVMAV